MELLTLDKFPPKVLAGIDVQRAFLLSRLIIAAERLQLFRVLHGKRMKAATIGRALNLHQTCLHSFLNSFVSLGLLHKKADTYWNSRLAEKYFIQERSIYWTRQYSRECVRDYEALTVLEEALASGQSCATIQGLNTPTYIDTMKRDRREAEDFTQMLFHFHHDDAEALAKHLDLSRRRAVLDVGGGSGVMSIALAKRYPRLRACVLDLETVCEIAAGNIKRAKLAKRVTTRAGDIREPLPTGYDVILFCDIGRVTEQHLRNAYDALPAGGMAVAVDRYFSDDGTKPLDRLLSSFAGSSFPMATRTEMVARLRSCDFESAKAKKVHRDLWCISGIKPAIL